MKQVRLVQQGPAHPTLGPELSSDLILVDFLTDLYIFGEDYICTFVVPCWVPYC